MRAREAIELKRNRVENEYLPQVAAAIEVARVEVRMTRRRRRSSF
jgi:hypothetical protein